MFLLILISPFNVLVDFFLHVANISCVMTVEVGEGKHKL